MRVAVVGTRAYAHPDDVRRLVELIAADAPGATIVSGGADGPDFVAEQTARESGLKVISYRAYKISDLEYGVEEWAFGSGPSYVRKMVEQPTWAKYEDALFYRNTLIVDNCDRLVAFWDGWSGGTAMTLGYAKDQAAELRPDLKVTVYDDGEKRLP